MYWIPSLMTSSVWFEGQQQRRSICVFKEKITTSKQLVCKRILRQSFQCIQLVLDNVLVLDWYTISQPLSPPRYLNLYLPSDLRSTDRTALYLGG